VVAPTNAAQADTTIALASTTQGTGYVTIVSLAPAPPPSAAEPAVPGFAGYDTGTVGTGYAADSSAGTAPAPVPANGSLAQRALAVAEQHNGGTYVHGASGPDKWDCAGFVLWCYAQCGYTFGGQVTANADGSVKYALGAGGIYQWFANQHGGKAISVDQAQPGDLLFCGPAGNAAAIGHACFCSQAGGFNGGQCFGANNTTDGVRAFAIGQDGKPAYWDDNGNPFAFAADMSGVTLNS
jgi:cell wall-associated NlpC family hydrolase